MMRYSLLLVFCALLGFQAYGQKIKSKYPIHLIKAQGGYIIDNSGRHSYKGFHLVSAGWATHKNRRLQGADFEFISYDRDNNRDSYELSYYYSRGVIGDINHGLFLGGFASVGYFRNFYMPFDPTSDPKIYSFREECYCFNIGPKLDYVYTLNPWLFVIVSSRVSLMELGNYQRENIVGPNSSIPRMSEKFEPRMIKNQYQLMLGFGIKL